MPRLRPCIVLCSLALLASHAEGQLVSSFASLLYPHSISTAGRGEQAVAFADPFAALQYNPANLVFGRGTGISYYRNPWNLVSSRWGMSFPMEAVSAYSSLGEAGTFAAQYTHWDEGTVQITTPASPDSGPPFSFFQRSAAIGYARSFGSEISVGLAVRYAWMSFPPDQRIGKLLVSAGMTYRPDWWKDRLHFGFSLMNMGTQLVYPRTGLTESEVVVEEPLPDQMNLGVTLRAATRPGCDLDLSAAVARPITGWKAPPDYAQSRSSFSGLASGWSEFPGDVTLNWGLSYGWHPIELGCGISFFQEFTLGYFTTGKQSYAGTTGFLTHGLSVGLDADGTRVTAGYAGRWHNTHTSNYLAWDFPWETFEISVRTLLPSCREDSPAADVMPHRILLSAGFLLPSMTGRYLGSGTGSHTIAFTSKPIWAIEADFYLDETTALVASLDYSRLTKKDEYRWTIGTTTISGPALESGIESFSIESGFRIHPADIAPSLFAQVSIGITRLNPVAENTYPRYSYYSFDRITVGALVPLGPVMILPNISLKTLWMGTVPDWGTLGGYSAWEFGMNAGIAL
jgi:hypothetical protein